MSDLAQRIQRSRTTEAPAGLPQKAQISFAAQVKQGNNLARLRSRDNGEYR
jgi:hypothetical protein